MIEFSHVSKLFGAQKAVNDLNLNFQEGSFSVLIAHLAPANPPP